MIVSNPYYNKEGATIYDHDEYEKALAWVRENCKEGFDKNLGKNLPPVITKSKIVPADKDWEFIVKMTLIIRDILYGNPRLDEMGWHEEALGRNAVVGGFQGQRQWTDWLPNADFTEAIMASTFDWNGPKAPTPFATENDTCNGIAMMLGSLVSGSAPCFHDVRTYWSPEACERVTGQKPDGVAANGFIHLINSGATALDGSGACVDAKGNHVMKPFWEMTDADIKACLDATDWCRADYEYFRGGGYSSHFRCKAEMPVTMLRFNIVEGMLHTGGHILKNLRVSIFNSTRFFVAVVHHQYSHRRKNDGSTEMIKRNDGISEDDICQNQCATLVRA